MSALDRVDRTSREIRGLAASTINVENLYIVGEGATVNHNSAKNVNSPGANASAGDGVHNQVSNVTIGASSSEEAWKPIVDHLRSSIEEIVDMQATATKEMDELKEDVFKFLVRLSKLEIKHEDLSKGIGELGSYREEIVEIVVEVWGKKFEGKDTKILKALGRKLGSAGLGPLGEIVGEVLELPLSPSGLSLPFAPSSTVLRSRPLGC